MSALVAKPVGGGRANVLTWSLDVPKADGHVVAAARHEVPGVGAADHLPNRVVVPRHYPHRDAWLPNVPNSHRLVYRPGYQREVLILVPVTRKN